MALWKIVPPEEGSGLCHRFVDHGREVCTARTTPHCERSSPLMIYVRKMG